MSTCQDLSTVQVEYIQADGIHRRGVIRFCWGQSGLQEVHVTSEFSCKNRASGSLLWYDKVSMHIRLTYKDVVSYTSHLLLFSGSFLTLLLQSQFLWLPY